MFKSHYQGGVYVEIFSAQGKAPAAKWSQSGKVQRIFDKQVKSYVYNLEGGPSTKMQVPRDEKQGLSLIQQFVVLQLAVPLGVGFNVQILATDTLNSKRRIFLSSAHRDISHTPLHTRLPLGMLTRGQWVNLAINVASVVSDVFNSTFKSIEMISVSASCKLRKVFTMKNQPHNTASGIYSPIYDGPTETIPKACTLNVGTATQVVDMAVIRQWVENQQPKVQRETEIKSAPQNPQLRGKPSPTRNAHSAEHQRKVQSSLEQLNKQNTIARNKRRSKQAPSDNSTINNTTEKSPLQNNSHVKLSPNRVSPSRAATRTALSPEKRGESLGTEPDLRRTTTFLPKSDVRAGEMSPIDHSTPNPLMNRDHSNPNVLIDRDHSTPNPLMNRVLDVSFTSTVSNIPTNENYRNDNYHDVNGNENRGDVKNLDIIRDIADGNITFGSSRSSQRSSLPSRESPVKRSAKPPSRSISRVTEINKPGDITGDVTGDVTEKKVYNSKDYEDEEDVFAASDEDLKYRMKALALYNGELDDSMDFSTSSRRSKRSTAVGPGGPTTLSSTHSDNEEIEEKLGENTDTSSSDATVLSHAQEVLLSGSVGHTSFLQDSIGKTYENRQTDRAYSPPICYPDELTRQATLPHHNPPPDNNPSTIDEDSGEEELDLLYDPVLNCYFDPKTCKYYELA